jgi:hypothetical protein
MKVTPSRVSLLTTALAAFSVTVHAVWLSDGVPAAAQHWVALAVCTVLFALADKFVVIFPVRRGSHTISLSEIPLVLGLVLFDPAVLLAARLAGGLAGLALFRHQRGTKLAFNTALYATQVTVACAIYGLVLRSADPLSPLGWTAAYAATFVADLISVVLVTAVIAMHDDGQEWRRLLSADVRSLFQAPLVAVTTTFGLVTAVVVRERVLAAALLAVLALAIHRVFQRYAQQTQGHAQVEALYTFTRDLSGSRDAGEVARTVLGRVRDLVRAETAELLIIQPGGASS